MEAPAPPPEGALLHRARESASITITEAARSAGITDTRWSQIERGYERRKGTDVPARAKAGTLARMAQAIALSPERLEDEGERPDAAEILREIQRTAAPSAPVTAHGAVAYPEQPAGAPAGLPEVTEAARRRYPHDLLLQMIESLPSSRGKRDELIRATLEAREEEDRAGDPGASEETALQYGLILSQR